VPSRFRNLQKATSGSAQGRSPTGENSVGVVREPLAWKINPLARYLMARYLMARYLIAKLNVNSLNIMI